MSTELVAIFCYRVYYGYGYHTPMKNIPLALTYDDVLVIPRRSTFTSRKEANTSTRLTKQLSLNIPLVSANMDTVTESDMAIALARLGGIGIIHRFMAIEDNVEEVKRVKRAQNVVIHEPYHIASDKTIAEAKALGEKLGVGGFMVVHDDGRLAGVLSNRDVLFAGDNQKVSEVMTPREKLIVGNASTTFDEARALFAKHKIEKLPLVDAEDRICGLINSADIQRRIEYPLSANDREGRLLVGAAVGVRGDYIERAQATVAAGADVLVIDIAHGHSDLMFAAIEKVRAACPTVPLIVGNVATAQATKELCEVGVDAVKVGVGPGTTCVTRLVTGCGVPQLSAVLACAEVAAYYNVPIIADGGIQKSGDIVKALGAGASSVMIGGLFAGTTESPGVFMRRGDKKYKVCRGSASFAVAQRRSHAVKEEKDLNEVVSEGVESIVPFKGPIEELVGQLVGGLKSGMSYVNSHSIAELTRNAEFVQITNAGLRESGPHDLYEVK